MVRKAFFEGALILVNMDGHDFNMPTNSEVIIQYFAWRSLAVHLIFYVFMSKNKKKPKKKKQKPKNICKKVDQKPERVVYPKREPKEREREKM